MKTLPELGIAGFNRLFCECLARVLAGGGRFAVRDHGDDFASLRDRLRRGIRPDIVLIDLSLARGTVLERVREMTQDADVSIVLLGIERKDRATLDCVEAGGKGVVPVDASLETLLASIDTVLRGELAFSRDDVVLIHQRLTELSRARFRTAAEAHPLTSRELEVLQSIDRGLRNRDIAELLGLSVHTIKNHVHHILEKLGSGDRHEAARTARHRGWIDSDSLV